MDTEEWQCVWCGASAQVPPYFELYEGEMRVHGKCWRPFKRRVERNQQRTEKRTAMRFPR